MSSRRNMLELYVAEKLKSIYRYSRPTIASGATPIEKGDIKNPYFMIECKDWNTDSFSIKHDVWKTTKSLADREFKDAVYIVENKSSWRLAIMDLEDWFELVNELFYLRSEQNDGK